MRKAILLLIFFVFCFTKKTISQPTISYQPFAGGFTQPVDLAHAGDDRLFVVERKGTIKIIDGNTALPTPFLDISDKTSADGDRGLLSIAFHPDYKKNGYFFVYYTQKTSEERASGALTIARYKVSADNPNMADPASGVVLLSILKPVGKDGTTFKDHNGGDLNFGADGKLYFATGDGGKEAGMEAPVDPLNNSQNKHSLLGKLIRLDVDKIRLHATAKADIVAMGLRNPWRWSFDRATGDIWIGDVGHYKREEVDFIVNEAKRQDKLKYKPGLNFGWRCYEGNEPYDLSGCDQPENYDFPVYEYVNHRSTGGAPASVTGGYVYRGTQYPALQGYYISADVYSGEIHLVKALKKGSWLAYQQPNMKWVVSFAEDKNGELYAIAYNTGKVYKVTAEGSATENVESESDYTFWSDKSTGKDVNSHIQVYPTLVQNGQLNIWSSEPLHELKLFNSKGSLRFRTRLNAEIGNVVVNLPALPKGVYFLLITGKGAAKKEKVIIP